MDSVDSAFYAAVAEGDHVTVDAGAETVRLRKIAGGED